VQGARAWDKQSVERQKIGCCLQRRHWQQVRKMILDEEANMAAVSGQLRLAVLKDAKLDVAKMPT
jgi:hypothetical protein